MPLVVIKNSAYACKKGGEVLLHHGLGCPKAGAYPQGRELHVWRLAFGHLHHHDTQTEGARNVRQGPTKGECVGSPPKVDFSVVVHASDELGRHPIRRSYHRVSLLLLLCELGGIAKVGCCRRKRNRQGPNCRFLERGGDGTRTYLDLSGAGDEQVVRLDVSVYAVEAVNIVQRLAGL
jgi:hypothetical protein